MSARLPATLCAALAVAGLAACGEKVRSGSPEPPAEFGHVEKSLVGCPSMQGVYLWPPEAGAHSKGFPKNRQPWEDRPWPEGVPAWVHKGRMQIWVAEKSHRLVFRSRDINLSRNSRDSQAQQWGVVEHAFGDCKSNMLEFKPEPVSFDTKLHEGTGRKIGFRLARMADGALAVGIKTVATGRSTSLFGWGDVHRGSVPQPDAVDWEWSKLRRIGPGDSEPPPMDAAQLGTSGR